MRYTRFAAIGFALARLLRALVRLLGKDPSYFRTLTRRQTSGGPITRTLDYPELCRIWESRRAEYAVHLESRPCPCCDAPEHEPLFRSQDGFPYVRCARCRMWYVSHYLPDAVWARYQREEPAVAALHDRQFVQSCSEERYEADKARFAGYFDVIRELLPGKSLDGLSYLDVGSFTGNSLRVAGSHGMAAFGIESSPRALEYVRTNHISERVYASGDDLARALPGRSMDCVSLWETLEHRPAPLEVLTQARGLLRPGGLLALTVPNAHSALPLILKDYCFYCFGGADVQGHINMFSFATLRRVLGRAGFRPLHEETIYNTDWEQVVFYLMGEWDKVYCPRNLMSGSCLDFEAPAWTAELSGMVGPDLSRLEKVLKAGPMIFAVAEAV